MSEKTFRELDGDMLRPEPSSALELWYIAVRYIPIRELSLFDIARAIRQNQHLEYIVPCALKHLEADPLAGDMMDGEVVHALKRLPPEYWRAHREQLETLIELADKAYVIYENDDELILLPGDLLGE